MSRILGLVVAGGLVLGQASVADAQLSLSIGNPYNGGYAIGQPYGYGLGGTTYYGSGYSGYVAPNTTYYSPGVYAPYPYTYNAPVYAAPRAYVPYRNYGYGYGYRRGFGGPFWGRRRW